MASPDNRWWRDPELWIEAFATVNIGGLTFDIYLAHSVNAFRSRAEYIPLFFSAVAPIIMAIALAVRRRHRAVWKALGLLVGGSAVVVGLSGVVFHLESHFFAERTLRSLTYSAPFVAPLAFTGLGFLLVMNRMVSVESAEWGNWVLFFALGGYVGNFVLSLVDHAENGFFFPLEWVPVCASALAVGFLLMPLVMRVSRAFLNLCAAILALEGAVGVWGFLLHAGSNLHGPSTHLFENFIYGAAPLAPLLFPNLMLLGVIGLWQLRGKELPAPQ
jgi:uncharacterized membrane protein YhaH (DUF805 family)